MKKQTHVDGRNKQRFDLPLAVHVRLSLDGASSRWGSGTIHDISSGGISFRCRREFPVGGRLELIVDWPAMHAGMYPISLRAVGLVVRSRGSKTAVRLTSHHFQIDTHVARPMGATA